LGPESPLNYTFGGGASETLIHPLILIAMLLAAVFILFGPRKWLPVPFILVVFLGAVGQQIYFGGFHFYVTRILVITAILRIIISAFAVPGPLLAGGTNAVDGIFVFWVICRCGADVILNNFASGAWTYQIGWLIDAIGGYMLMRFAIREEEDMVRVLKVFAALTCIFTITMADEKFHNQNIFGFLGVLPVSPGVREGAIRAGAAFAHPILAGVFGVALVPLFWWLYQSGKAKTAGALGFCGSMGMMLMSASSTPLLAFAAATIAWFAWPFRGKLQYLRWGIVILLIGLHLVMKAPVWMLIARVDLIAGNSGYHRAMLIDQCIRHFWDWWLIGTNDAGTWGWDLWDTSNQFVQEAESGGLLTFILFIAIISLTFRRLAKARIFSESEGDLPQARFMWAQTVTLFTHCVCFFGISYFDHTKMMWYAFLAIAAASTSPILARIAAIQEEPEPAFGGPLKPALATGTLNKISAGDEELEPVSRSRSNRNTNKSTDKSNGTKQFRSEDLRTLDRQRR
jgi:hypothetical protein